MEEHLDLEEYFVNHFKKINGSSSGKYTLEPGKGCLIFPFKLGYGDGVDFLDEPTYDKVGNLIKERQSIDNDLSSKETPIFAYNRLEETVLSSIKEKFEGAIRLVEVTDSKFKLYPHSVIIGQETYLI